MHRVIRIALLLILASAFSGGAALGQQAAPSPQKSNPAATPIPLAKIPLAAESDIASLQVIDATVSRERSSANIITASLANLTNEIGARVAEDTRLLTASPSLDLLYRLNTTWKDFNNDLSALGRELTESATTLENALARLDQLSKSWQATLEFAVKRPDTPPPVMQRLQRFVDSIERTRQAAESDRVQELNLQSSLSETQARVQTALSSVEQSQNRALKNLLVRDSPPVWSHETNVRREWAKQSGASFSSQMDASTAFVKRLPFSLLIHAFLIVFIAGAVQWMRLRIGKLAEQEPGLQRAVPILDLPVSTACALSLLIVPPSVYPQAPRLIQAIMGAVALIPIVVILRRLLERKLYPIVNALVVLYFIGHVQMLVASLPVLARLLFLGEMLSASLFLAWLIRGAHLGTTDDPSDGRFLRAMRTIAKIGLVLLPAAFFANIFGYANLGNLLGLLYLRSVYLAAMLYVSIRVLEGVIIVALQVRPLGMLRVVRLHRLRIQHRTCRVLEFLAFLFWLDTTLNYFGLRTPLIVTAIAALNANLAIGSINISIGQILAFLIAVWAAFLFSKFLRFLLEEDVYHYFHLARGVPYAISTTLHYIILLLGFLIALGALGIDLTKITILAGAFSVGVGFGLQNVINNFVSGLILLFERPIKIGDVIEVSGNVGEVRRIGIRASVIRTADGAEVIVPNGSLISSQVTNWTFSDRERAVEVSVSVVGGADPQRVIESLKSTAAAQPGVAKNPSPQVYVVNFSAAAVTFQLRAWTDRYQDWAQLRSDLSVAINETLAREKITIA
jgi:potassium efflux system protein